METKLSKKMKQLGYTDVTLAEAIGRHRTIVTKMRNGKLIPSLKMAIKIGDVLGIRPEDLLTGDNK